jgi:hypothetical protein
MFNNLKVFLPPTHADKGGQYFYARSTRNGHKLRRFARKNVIAPKALKIRVAASRRHPVLSLSVAKVFSKIFNMRGQP